MFLFLRAAHPGKAAARGDLARHGDDAPGKSGRPEAGFCFHGGRRRRERDEKRRTFFAHGGQGRMMRSAPLKVSTMEYMFVTEPTASLSAIP